MSETNERPVPIAVLAVVGLVSALLLAGLVKLVYFTRGAFIPPAAVEALPAVNAVFNSLSATSLVLAVRAIRAQDRPRHETLTKAAFGFSVLFLASYVVYHAAHGDTPFLGEGVIRGVYFAILGSHIVLSAVAMPLILMTFFLSLTGRFAKHRRIARVTFPIWLYVSVTGVLIFLLLKLFG